jgi:uncharacterized protein (DUF2235 family)
MGTSSVVSKDSPPRGVPNAEAQNPVRQRLVICFDGTWNRRDSGTSIYHLANLIEAGEVTDETGMWVQRIHYDEGVGTGVLDGVTGGAFGFGLSQNVREAYDWLVELYNDGDEIYVFGFSRGAFTARSLVGLIAKCGLLHRGAPLPVDELWHGYQILGRHRDATTGAEPDPSLRERVFGKRAKLFRALHELQHDAWEDGTRAVATPANRAERLLVQWSRRVPIDCVGVFDTVGSMGLDALAIPWLRDTSAQFHDTRLSALVLHGFHALAIDEHRANFAHIPWHRLTTDPGAPQMVAQRWFVGSHSNVGGGYEDDALAQFPLQWMVEECARLGLAFRAVLSGPNPIGATIPGESCPLLDPEPAQPPVLLARKPASLRDSFAEFAGGVWQHLIRAKREYRRIAPPPELQNGKPVQSVNEELHDSVLKLRAANRGTAYNPPNLFEYRQRRAREVNVTLDEAPPPPRFLEGLGAWFGLLVWMLGVASAGWWLAEFLALHVNGGRLFGPGAWDELTKVMTQGRIPWSALHVILAGTLPVLAVFVDWRESMLNHLVTLEPDGLHAECRRAWMDAYLAVRLGAVGAFALGAGLTLFHWFELDWPLLRLLPAIGHWLFAGWPPSPTLFWLFVFDGLLLVFLAAKAWCGGPMTDAGLGSIVQLQRTSDAEAAQGLLLVWAGGKNRQLLAPVARTLWRDILGFIPIYALVLFAGTWLGLSIWSAPIPEEQLIRGILGWNRHCLLPAVLVPLLCAAADYVEDVVHLRYLEAFPNAPSQNSVRVARYATMAKFVFFFIGLVATTLGVLGLVWGEVKKLAHLECGGLALLVAGFTLLVLFVVLRDLRSGAKPRLG